MWNGFGHSECKSGRSRGFKVFDLERKGKTMYANARRERVYPCPIGQQPSTSCDLL